MNERSAPRLAFSPASSRVLLPARWRAFSLLGAIVLVRLVIQVAAMNRYGYFRDELYYLAITDHLDWGYVDHPPLSIAILSLIRTAFGESLTALRAVPALVGAATVYLTAFVCRQFGGGRFAQGLAALSVCLSPVFLGTAHYYSMNVFDQLYWTLAVMVLLRALDTERRIAWCVLGVVLRGYGGRCGLDALSARHPRAGTVHCGVGRRRLCPSISSMAGVTRMADIGVHAERCHRQDGGRLAARLPSRSDPDDEPWDSACVVAGARSWAGRF
jgi:hypothetical protein